MLGGYYTAASGVLTRQRELDVIGNNLVNSQTPGYRGDRLLISPFEQELLTRREANGAQQLGNGKMATAAIVGGVTPLMNSGLIKDTGRTLDMAINGAGFYNIQSEGGKTYLTRNGQFDLDEEGYLVLPGFGRVLGEGNTEIQLENENFQVETDGTIFDWEGEEVEKLLVTEVPNLEDLVKENNGMFALQEGATGQEATNYSIVQRNLELSNIDMNREMTSLLEAQRAFQACSSALQTIDALNRKAATQIATL